MLDLILLTFFSFRIYRLAVEKGVSPAKWIARFVLSYFAVCLMFAIVLVLNVGVENILTEEGKRQLAPYMLLMLVALVGIFLIFQYKLKGMPDVEYYDDEPDTGEQPHKKDLSYFR